MSTAAPILDVLPPGSPSENRASPVHRALLRRACWRLVQVLLLGCGLVLAFRVAMTWLFPLRPPGPLGTVLTAPLFLLMLWMVPVAFMAVAAVVRILRILLRWVRGKPPVGTFRRSSGLGGTAGVVLVAIDADGCVRECPSDGSGLGGLIDDFWGGGDGGGSDGGGSDGGGGDGGGGDSGGSGGD
jgi:uncharacterized membrane protein YgcG